VSFGGGAVISETQFGELIAILGRIAVGLERMAVPPDPAWGAAASRHDALLTRRRWTGRCADLPPALSGPAWDGSWPGLRANPDYDGREGRGFVVSSQRRGG
jgi:hypothetical protein